MSSPDVTAKRRIPGGHISLHFADVSGESVPRIAQRIREDRIGILIDLNGYTRNARPAIFALRPAPVQINAIGFQATLGTPWHDYILTDRFSLPEPLQRFYTERPLYMPHVLYPSDTARRGLGLEIAQKASAAKGPTVILLPLRGVSAIDKEGGPFWWPEADYALFQPAW